jgi:hypothetical protein
MFIYFVHLAASGTPDLRGDARSCPPSGASAAGEPAAKTAQQSKTAMLSTWAVCGNMFTALAAVQR